MEVLEVLVVVAALEEVQDRMIYGQEDLAFLE